jgi:peptidoglycan hydrolase CwlO-like protein
MQRKLEEIDVQFEKIDRRFDRIDERMDRIETDVKKGNRDMIIALIGATATIIAAFVGVITVML